MTLLAKSLIKNRLWLVTNGKFKVGKIEATNSGYDVKIGNKSAHFDDTDSIEQAIKIEFDRPSFKSKQTKLSIWPTTGKTYNDVFDVRRKLHIYTKSAKSKCYYAAGYFKMKLDGEWTVVFCPKYIFLQRYEYVGPYMTESEANSS